MKTENVDRTEKKQPKDEQAVKPPKESFLTMSQNMHLTRKKIKKLRKRHMELFFILQTEQDPPLSKAKIAVLEQESAQLEKALNEGISKVWHYRLAMQWRFIKVVGTAAILFWLFEHYV